MKLLQRVRTHLEETWGGALEVESQRPLGGGCINDAFEFRTSAGSFFVKSNAQPIPDLFSAEAAGLRALGASGSTLAIPDVVGYEDPGRNDGFLIMEFLAPGRRVPDFFARLGRGLAELHRTTSPKGFGFDIRTYCGTTPQPNHWAADWIEFYRDRRLGHLLKLLVDAGDFGRPERKMTETLLGRLSERLGSPEPPSLLHGDLWSGNLHCTSAGEPALIDPAVYFGHREAELGMMMLFGGFSDDVFHAYEETYPLQPEWRTRNALYQLYHVMNHAVLFGGSFVSQSVSIIRRFA